MLKVIIFGLLGLTAAFFIGGWFLSGSYDVRSSIEIQATPQQIHGDIADLRKWREWSVWNDEADPQCKHEYEGPESGKGAKWHWVGPKLLQGTMTVTEASPQKGVFYTLKFMDYPEMTGGLEYSLEDGKTTVVWRNAGEIPGITGGWVALIMPSAMETEYSKCLTNLKQRVEKRVASGGQGEPAEAAAKKK